MRGRKLTGIFLLTVFLGVLVGACATTSPVITSESFVKASYKTLVTAADVYDTGMKTAATLYKKGIINEAQKEKIIKVGKKYYNAWHVARDALEEYKKAQTPANKSALELAIDAFIRNQGDLLKLLKDYMGGA